MCAHTHTHRESLTAMLVHSQVKKVKDAGMELSRVMNNRLSISDTHTHTHTHTL